MTRYTVLWWPPARDDLALLWIESRERESVSEAANAIDRELAEDAAAKGAAIHEGLRRLVLESLEVAFSVDEEDRLTTVWSVRKIDEQQ